jgi:hypothetical protein
MSKQIRIERSLTEDSSLPLLFDRDRKADTHKKPSKCLWQMFSIRWEETKSGIFPLPSQP